MTGSTRRGIGVSAVVAAGFLVLLWSAAAGPASVFGTEGLTLGPRLSEVQEVGPTPPPPTIEPGPAPERSPDPSRVHDLTWVADLLRWTVLLLLFVALVLAAMWLWRHRWRPLQKPTPVEFEVLPVDDAVPAALSREASTQLAMIEEGSPQSAIVRCWLRLEEAVAEAGLPRVPSETSSEFTLRVLRNLDVDPRAVATLARLFREARFSEHELGEQERSAARSALQHLYADLAHLQGAGPGAAP